MTDEEIYKAHAEAFPNPDGLPVKSYITRCRIEDTIPPTTWVWFKAGEEVRVTMDRMMVCPIDLFTDDEVDVALQRYRAAKANASN